MKKLVLIGAGGHCLSILDTLAARYCYDDIVITDNDTEHKSNIYKYRVVGDDMELPKLFKQGYREAFITIGSIKSTDVRHKAFESAEKIGYIFPMIIDRTASVSCDVQICRGVFIGKNAIINTATKIGEFAIINSGAIIEHECLIGDFTHVAVGAVVCGGCNVGNDVFIGANATIINGVNIGNNCIIGAGSLVLADLPENMTVCGIWGR